MGRDRVEEIRILAFDKVRELLPALATVEEVIIEAKKLEAYIDVSVNADPKTLPKE